MENNARTPKVEIYMLVNLGPMFATHPDAIIGLSVVYKALDNFGASQHWLGFQPDTKAATLTFGLFHVMGLATKILDYDMRV